LASTYPACSVGWFVSLLVREEVLLADLCERKILFRLKIYDRLRQATAKRTGCRQMVDNKEDLLLQIGTARERKNSFNAQNFIAEKKNMDSLYFFPRRENLQY